jgi:2-polyprenyl-6-methoxyphenol hydroxylase-like FAD-dependent oxidoreductase
MDDVLIVGGRCAGGPLAMLLARAGLRVRVVERAHQLGDVVSGHMIKPAGVARLRAWGLYDDVLASGVPPLRSITLWLDGQPQPMPTPPLGFEPIAPRRTRLDPILLDAAAQAGAHVERGVSVTGVLTDGERVTGVATSRGARRARLVVGADGRHSRIARAVRAKPYVFEQPVTFAYYTYWRGTRVDQLHAWLQSGRFFGMFPVGDDRALAFVQAPRAEFDAFRADPVNRYRAELAGCPALAELIGDGAPVERLRGIGELPTFFRVSAGRGWALVGDAGHHKDPVIARGIADAFRDADVLSAAILAGWDSDLDAAVRAYPAQRDACSRPLSDANLDLASLHGTAESLGARWVNIAHLERSLDEAVAAAQSA